jgi:DNA modification methylase
MTMRILIGDARDRLRELPDESVHCVVTSPPYYGLRDYGTAQWDDGDAECDHSGIRRRHGDEKQSSSAGTSRDPVSRDCRRCGAKRIDRQIGLEPSPAEYVETLVAVFRDVRRVLRKDGTCWLNLGLSYASGGMSPSRSRQPEHVPPCDTDGKEPRYSPAPDFVYPDPDGERRDGSLSHHDRSADTGSRLQQSALPLSLTGHDTARSDYVGAPPLLPGAPVSTTHASQPHVLAGPDLEATASARLTIDPTLLADVLGSAHTAARTSGTAQLGSVLRNRDKDVSGLACRCGSCGFCFIRLAMGALPFKPKDEMNLPHLVAMALQADGWFLRQTIVWSKPNPMPESVTDRCTKAHEYLFLLSKSERYWFDQESIKEACSPNTHARVSQDLAAQVGSFRANGGNKTNGPMKAVIAGSTRKIADAGSGIANNRSYEAARALKVERRNRRSVWEIPTLGFSEAHFATFPPALVEPCILAGTSEKGVCAKCGEPWARQVERESRPNAPSCNGKYDGVGKHRTVSGGVSNDGRRSFDRGFTATCSCNAAVVPATVLDPFFGAGTTGIVADRLGRDCIGIELNPAYAEMTRARLVADAGMFANVEVAA